MKELSIKEKAKAYDKALKVLHKYDGVNIMFSQSLKEEMFPELAESEDEKIRKEMIEILKKEAHDFPSSVIANKSNSWIAWLEKQKDICPNDIEKWREEKHQSYVAGQQDVINNPSKFGLQKPETGIDPDRVHPDPDMLINEATKWLHDNLPVQYHKSLLNNFRKAMKMWL